MNRELPVGSSDPLGLQCREPRTGEQTGFLVLGLPGVGREIPDWSLSLSRREIGDFGKMLAAVMLWRKEAA